MPPAAGARVRPTETAEHLFLSVIDETLQRSGPTTAPWRAGHDPHDPTTWISAFPADYPMPVQGWKLHLSATVASAEAVLRRSLPILLVEQAPFKVAASLDVLTKLNHGESGLSQAGKFMTIYPADDVQAVRLAVTLDEATRDLAGPPILSDRALHPGSLVFYRYGGFRELMMQTPTGLVLAAVRGPDGCLVPDYRLEVYHKPGWATDPFLAAGVTSMPEPTLVIAGRYLIVAMLSRSPRGAVYLAIDLRAGGRCILKRARRHATADGIGRDARDRLRHEATVLAALAPEPGIPRSVDLVEQDGDLFLAMEDIAGETLEELMTPLLCQGRTLPPEQVVRWGRELAMLLAAIHAKGYIYHDLKSSNVIVTPEGPLRLVDFELAYPRSGGPAPFGRGTPGYMSPQQQQGQIAAVTDDVYALGAILYFAVTGAEPALAPRDRPLLSRPLSLINPALDPTLARLIERCLDPDPGRRFPSMTDVGEALKPLGVADAGIAPAPTCEAPVGAPDHSRHRYGELARRLGDSICAAEPPAPDGPGRAWDTTRRMTVAGPGSRDVNAGGAGAILALAELVGEFGDEHHRSTLRSGARRLAIAPPFEGSPLPGLYVGEAGIGAALLRAGQVLRDEELIAAATAKGQLVAALPHTSPDLFNGSAGRLRFHLMLWDETGDPEHLDAAIAAGTVLLAAADDAGDGGVRWSFPPGFEGLSGAEYLGYAHGAAGIADALLDLFEATGDERYFTAAQGAGRWLARCSLPALDDQSGLAWPSTEDGQPSAALWCHGATGIGRFFLHAAELGALPAASVLAAGAARAAARGTRWHGPTQCHGLAGSIEFLLDMAQSTGEPVYLDDAYTLARLLEAFVVEQQGNRVVSSEQPDVFSPDYMVGYAGVAVCLLRLSDPDRLSHQLSRRGFRHRPTVTEAPAWNPSRTSLDHKQRGATH